MATSGPEHLWFLYRWVDKARRNDANRWGETGENLYFRPRRVQINPSCSGLWALGTGHWALAQGLPLRDKGNGPYHMTRSELQGEMSCQQSQLPGCGHQFLNAEIGPALLAVLPYCSAAATHYHRFSSSQLKILSSHSLCGCHKKPEPNLEQLVYGCSVLSPQVRCLQGLEK